jgi:hypothetical protein
MGLILAGWSAIFKTRKENQILVRKALHDNCFWRSFVEIRISYFLVELKHPIGA